MSVSGTNQSKNIATPYGQRKAGVYLWGDAFATWGDAIATWGGFAISPTNQSKSTTGGVTIPAGSAMGLLLSITYPSAVVLGSGVINQSKS